MTRQLGYAVAAELTKLRTLPVIPATVLGMGVMAMLLVMALSGAQDPDAVSPILQLVPLLQVGAILLGVLVAATEYGGSQICTTLTATPNRVVVLAGKTAAYLVTSAVGSAATVTGGFVGGWAGRLFRGDDPPPVEPLPWPGAWPVAGAATYLVLIGLLAHALAVLLRSLIPPLVAMLSLVLIASPLLVGVTGHARWLPDRAGRLLYLPDASAVLTPWTGALLLLAWITVVGAGAAVAFLIRDA